MKMYNAAKYLLSKDVQVVPLNDNKKPTVSFKNVTIDDEFIDNNFFSICKHKCIRCPYSRLMVYRHRY